jgi:hypothetical protein
MSTSPSSLSFRVVAAAAFTASTVALFAPSGASAQTCSISSTARGPLSCSVTTTVHMSMRVPEMVAVAMTAPSASLQMSLVVRAGLSVKTNRSYSLQIASAPGSASRERVTWTTGPDRGSLDETPAEIDASDRPSSDREPIQLAFARDSRRDVSAPDPIRLILTVVAP